MLILYNIMKEICSNTLIHLGMKQAAVFLSESMNHSLNQNTASFRNETPQVCRA